MTAEPIPSTSRRTRRIPRRGEAGYNLVILIVAATLVSTGVAIALPSWSHFDRREKEEELIFRGLQYAEAIRLFQVRVGRLPTKLEELIEIEPRCIRQLYPNPMTESGKWGKIYNTGGPNARTGPGVSPEVARGLGLDGAEDDEDGGEPRVNQNGDLLSGGREGEETTGPIRGVYSPEGGETIKTWFGSNNVRDWQFTFDILQAQQPGNAGSNPGTTQTVPINSGQLGRPLPPGIQQVPGAGASGLPGAGGAGVGGPGQGGNAGGGNPGQGSIRDGSSSFGGGESPNSLPRPGGGGG